MKKLGKVFVALTLTMFSYIASANAGSVQLGKRDSLYVVDNGRTYYGPGSGARGEICNLGDYNCAARQTARANGGFGRHGYGHRGYGHRGYGHRGYGYFVPRHFVPPPVAMRRLRPAYRYGYGVAAPVAAGFTVGAVIGARGGYAAVGGAPYIPTPVGVSVVPINPPRSAAVTVPSAQPSPEAILEAQRAAGNVLRIPNKCAAGWTLTERGTCATVEFDTVASATPACEQGWILTERGTCAMTVRE